MSIRPMIRMMALASVLTIGSGFGIGVSSAAAQGYGYGGYPVGGYYGGGIGGGYPVGGYPVGGYYGGGYAVPSFSYFGNGGHDLQPHGHIRQGLFGTRSYYGMGLHDVLPHGHTQTPYGITGYSGGLFGATQSFSPPTPYGYRHW